MTQEVKFVDFKTPLNIMGVMISNDRVYVSTDRGILIFGSGALPLLAKRLKTKVAELIKWDTDKLLNALRNLKNTLISTYTQNDKVFYVYRVTSDKYVPIPHSTLFKEVQRVLARANINVLPRVYELGYGVLARWSLDTYTIRVRDRHRDIGLYLDVFNANDGRHAIKVYAYSLVLQCWNGLILPEYFRSIRIRHLSYKYSVEDVLAKVKLYVAEIVVDRKRIVRSVEHIFNVFTEVPIDKKIVEWIDKKLERLPQRWRMTYRAMYGEAVREYGENMYTVLYGLTHLQHNVPKSYRSYIKNIIENVIDEVMRR